MYVPKIDKRTIEDIYKQLSSMLPYYTPEWRFNLESPDPGTALFIIFAEMFQETIDRFNKTPLKNYLAYLNMLDIDMKPVVPSIGYVCFNTSSGAVNKVFIPSGTKLFSDSEYTDSDRIIFETTQNFFVTPAKIKAIYNVDPVKDRIVNCYSQDGLGSEYPCNITLFDTEKGTNLQEHAFYLSENSVLSIKSPAVISVKLENRKNPHIVDRYLEKLSDPELVEWCYHTNDGWKPFEKIEKDKDLIVLFKSNNDILTSHQHDEGDIYISCRAKNILRLKEILADHIFIASSSDQKVQKGIQPDLIYSDDIPVENENGYCFGAQFSMYNCMYVKSDEVFIKKGAHVSIELDLDFIEKDFQSEIPQIDLYKNYKLIMDKNKFAKPEKLNITIQRILMEYWNGIGWVRIETESKIDNVFNGKTGIKHITFKCPDDISPVLVNSIDGYWIRFRIVDIENNFYVNGVYLSPWLKNMVLNYGYKGIFPAANKIININNSSEGNPIDVSKGVEQPVKMFSPLDDKKSTVYLCFDKKPYGIPINIYFQVLSQSESSVKELVWYAMSKYRGMKEWVEIRVDDKTCGFAKSGIVSIESGTDMIPAEYFGVEGYWFKIERNEFQQELLPMIDSIHMNAVKIVQKESHKDERHMLYANDLTSSVTLTYSPVIEEEVWVNEVGHINDDQINSLLQGNPSKISIVRDDEERVAEVWVLWDGVENFYDSGSNDRHYMIDRSKGIIYFGDGNKGKKVPEQEEENILVNYSSGGGSIGNLPEGSINNLLSPIAYIDSVSNIKPTCGGCDRQELNDVALLGPAVLRHRGRAVTLLDYQKLVKSNFIDARKVKCIPNVNNSGEVDYGCVTVVVMCDSYWDYHYNIDLCSEIRSFLLDRAFCISASNDKIFVVPPQLLELNVDCELVIEDMEAAASVEEALAGIVSQYLDPLRGADGKGWDIGEIPKPAHFYSTIKKIPGIKYIGRINLDASFIKNGIRKYIALDKPVYMPFAVPVNGMHKFRLRTD